MTATDQKVAVVTGAAAGIGLALTKHLIGRGFRVVLADIDEAKGTKTQQEIGSDALFVRCDVSDWDSNAAMFKKAYQWGGRIDFFAANAGVEERESVYNLPVSEGELKKPNISTIEVDLHSVFYGLRLFRYYVRESATGQGGRMVVSSSMAGIYPMYLGPSYSAAKHGIVGLIRSAAPKIHRDEGITLNAIAPGPVDTGINPNMHLVVPPEHMTPMKTLLDAFDKFIDEDITGEIAECASDGIYLRKHVDFANGSAKFLNEDMFNEEKFSAFYKKDGVGAKTT
ncbi:hypothetical protein B0J14DRAFT_707596 [Halenospora varia]|nr:hypothetical protein B0J14DRAFT_707596 [Halenospora varia]